MIKHSVKIGLSFGLTSGVITTLGLMVGLHSGTHSKIVIIGAILIMAIADASSDALGIHSAEESEIKHTSREIWESTIATFLSKFFFTATFVVPLLLFELSIAIVFSVLYGLFLLGIFSFYIAKEQRAKPWKVVLEHLSIAVIVIFITHYVGDWIGSIYG
jgi:VIT1/CCC1 family predicted Fe2+/Mn2+ transporter